ncbi:MAG TPA: hypothetical protein VF029_04865 [Actinomycetota bacterium]
MRELLSTARPTPLRLAGFLLLAGGAVAAGIGATREWAIVGFPQDEAGAADVPFRGTDVWEGKAVLLVAVAALVCLLALRLAQRASTRKALAVLLIAFGLAVATLPAIDALRSTDRFGGGEGLDRMVSVFAARLELPEEVVRQQLEAQHGAALRVDVAAGLWLSATGGLLLILGGALSLAWASRGRPPAPPAGG